MNRFTKIEGWFGSQEADFYRHQVACARDGARFVEIGSWKGRSSYCMAEAIRRSQKQIEFWCVDTWQGSTEHAQMVEVLADTLFDEFLENTSPLRDLIKPLRMTSLEAAKRFEDGSLDFVFIDAAHDYDSVLADIRAWRPKVKTDGVLAGHDYEPNWPGVVQAVECELGSAAANIGVCWYWSEKNKNCAPAPRWDWPKRLERKLRQWRNSIFRRAAA